jgi:hypothetical protein
MYFSCPISPHPICVDGTCLGYYPP